MPTTLPMPVHRLSALTHVSRILAPSRPTCLSLAARLHAPRHAPPSVAGLVPDALQATHVKALYPQPNLGRSQPTCRVTW